MKTHKFNHEWVELLLLAIFFGWLGAHRFIVGKTATGLMMALTLGGLFAWWVFDIIIIALGGFKDNRGRTIGWFAPIRRNNNAKILSLFRKQ